MQRCKPEETPKVVLLNSAPTNSKERQQQSASYFLETAEPERQRKFEHDFALLADDIERDPERRFVHINYTIASSKRLVALISVPMRANPAAYKTSLAS